MPGEERGCGNKEELNLFAVVSRDNEGLGGDSMSNLGQDLPI